MTPDEAAGAGALKSDGAVTAGPGGANPALFPAAGVARSVGRGARRWVAAAGFLAGYAALIYFFWTIDVYDRHFFDKQYAAVYNAMRCLFAFYLFVLLHTTGETIIDLVASRRWTGALGRGEKTVIAFFVGAVAWQFLMLGLGYLSLYTRPVIIVATLPAMLWASWTYSRTLSEIGRSLGARFAGYTLATRLAALVLAAILVAAGVLLAIVKGLYPAGGHDYYTHYFYYYIVCLKNHGIWPNEVWYHYFYSKGEGIFFLGMLLSDPLAPSIVTYCFIAVAAVALFHFIERAAANSLWPWVAVAAWLLILIYAGGENGLKTDNSNYWAEFSKEHEINAAFVVVLIWLADGLLRESGRANRLLLGAACACSFAVAYIEQPTPIFVGMVTVVVMLFLACRRQFGKAGQFFLLASAAGAGFVSNLVLNYVTTGVPSDAFINLFWPIINLDKTDELGWTWRIIKHSRDLVGVKANLDHLAFATFVRQLTQYCHVALLQPWFGYIQGTVFALGTVIVLGFARRRIPDPMRPTLLLLASLAIAFLVSAAMGAAFPDSFYRYASFFVPVEFAAGAVLWLSIGALARPRWAPILTGLVVPIIAFAFFAQGLWRQEGAQIEAVVKSGVRFVSGRHSIYDSYVDQAAWPARAAYGGIYPGSLAVWRGLGPIPQPRVWTFHIHSYCMLPGCLFESDESFPGSPRMADVMFGPLDQARAILQQEGLTYFLYSRELQIRDPLPATGIFTPEEISHYLGVKWTDGTTYLLTWLGPGVEPLSADWLAQYRKQVTQTAEVVYFQRNRLLWRSVYEQLKSHPHWGSQLKLPWLR
jgi:hypothetical protein